MTTGPNGAKRFYVTSPIYYVNDSPHIGHAYTTLACDVMARWKRLDGYDVLFMTGTDEHGQKVEKSANDAGIEPQAFTDKVSQRFRDLAVRLNCSNDDFLRTTQPRHIECATALWNALIERGEIYLGHYEGWYSVRDEAYWGEDELVDGPDGTKLAPTGAPVELLREPSYFFRLSQWGDRLLKFYDETPDFILPVSRRNEVTSFVKGGLQDLSVSRTTFKWGVPVPGDPAHIMYVWIEALSVYLTATGFPDRQGERSAFWPATLHMVGKDIVRFHAVYWPAILMAAGLEPPERVFAHGWWTNEGQKISKSLGNVIEPNSLIDEFGLDPLRFFLFREVPFGNDGDFSRKAMIGRLNSELANGLGNLAQRTLTQVARNCDGQVPVCGELTDADRKFKGAIDVLLEQVRSAIDRQAFHDALETIWVQVREANAYIDVQAPWALRKTDLARMQTVLYLLTEALRHFGILLQPFMPDSMDKLLTQVGVPADRRSLADLATPTAPGTPLPAPQGVFPRYVEAAA